jgi:RNA polymerase sigma-70 factor, ECF subfamily
VIAVARNGGIALDEPASWEGRAPRRRLGARGARDAALVRAAQRGSHDAIEELFERHWGAAHRAAYLIVRDAAAAEDVAQEAFLAAIRSLDRFDRRRPFAPWLHRIVANRAIDHARARALRRELSDAGLPERAAAEQARAAPGEELLDAIGALDPDQRAAIVLRHLLEYTPGEIARLLGVPRGTVNSRLRRGLDALGDALEQDR